ncbi:hypothetical protein [Halapricum desulfuricans]|uniref:Uncharacterized protein n=1 Tax=Halapricum desulfuricans TaxID=2841257 RepID=A0A897NBD3_9EURY|nr:hypothetical protein [Halapricum desulfuricans]QSG08403.1 hypothetical protein HSR122_1001 [Halapricum desulfuricans]
MSLQFFVRLADDVVEVDVGESAGARTGQTVYLRDIAVDTALKREGVRAVDRDRLVRFEFEKLDLLLVVGEIHGSGPSTFIIGISSPVAVPLMKPVIPLPGEICPANDRL